MGNVTLKLYKTKQGEERIDRTVIADAIMSASASTVDTSGTGVEKASDPHAPPAN